MAAEVEVVVVVVAAAAVAGAIPGKSLHPLLSGGSQLKEKE